MIAQNKLDLVWSYMPDYKNSKTNIKDADSLHLACAICTQSDYFIIVDSRVMKYHDNRIAAHAEPFDYKEWRRYNLFNDMTIEELSKEAKNYIKAKKANLGGYRLIFGLPD